MFPATADPSSPRRLRVSSKSHSLPKNWDAKSASCFPRRLRTSLRLVAFDLYSSRFTFLARDPIFFPAGMPGNILRGALGSFLRRIACVPECPGHLGRDVRECERRMDCAYARIFEPVAIAAGPPGAGPSGLSDWPRPFVLRVAHLDHHAVEPGQRFWFDVNLLEMRY